VLLSTRKIQMKFLSFSTSITTKSIQTKKIAFSTSRCSVQIAEIFLSIKFRSVENAKNRRFGHANNIQTIYYNINIIVYKGYIIRYKIFIIFRLYMLENKK
jgi:hypothetical protein